MQRLRSLSMPVRAFGFRRGLGRSAAGFGAANALGLCLLLLAGGCTTGRSGNGDAHAGENAVKPGANSLRYCLTSEPTTLDPAAVEDGTTIDLLQQIFEGLVQWNEKNEIVPNLAEKWEMSQDGKTYTFHIRSGVKFHNGRILTAADFKYSFERACDPKLKSPTASNYLKDIVGVVERLDRKASEISGIRVLNDSTLEIALDAFKPYWLGNMTYPCAFAVCKEDVEKNGGRIDEKSAVGTGPFKLAEFSRGSRVVLAVHPEYHSGRPKLDFIVRPILSDAGTRRSKYEADEIDIVDVPPGYLDYVNRNPTLKAELKTWPRAAIWYLAMNSAAADSPYSKKAVRQAFAMAIDKDEIARVALKGIMPVARGILPPGVPGFHPDVRPLPYDAARARALLAQAGYPDGRNFPLLTLSFRKDMPQVADTATILARQIKNSLNIDVQLRPMEWGQFLTERSNKTMALSHLRWAADYLDPQNFLSTLLHTSVKNSEGKEDHPENGVGYNNPEFDALCDRADVERDPQKRVALYRKAEQIAIDDAPWVPLYFQKDPELVKPRVKNIRDSLFGHLPYTTTTVTR